MFISFPHFILPCFALLLNPAMDDQASLVQTVLKERGILIKRDEIQSAFRGPDRDANASWVSKHLRDDTLLSKDELAL